MIAIQRDYADRGVRLVAVNSNDASRYAADSFEEMRQRAQSQGFNFDYLHDEDQSLARALGAERTPEVFVFDRDRRLATTARSTTAATRSTSAATTSATPSTPCCAATTRRSAETHPVGCTVKWRD